MGWPGKGALAVGSSGAVVAYVRTVKTSSGGCPKFRGTSAAVR
jgi:hypothetical protein